MAGWLQPTSVEAFPMRRSGRFAILLGGAALTAGLLVAAPPAHALSETQQDATPVVPGASQTLPDDATSPVPTVPLPDPVVPGGAGTEPEKVPDSAEPEDKADGPLPEIQYDVSKLPEPVQRLRNLLVEAAKSGDVEALRPLIEPGQDGTMLSFGEFNEDPISFLKGLSGDEQGQEILAILEEVLDAGFVRMGAGTPEELYVWPYFYAIPVDTLDKRQRVELFKLLTAGEYEEMKTYGAYLFYRVGISPEGRWAYFVAGD